MPLIVTSGSRAMPAAELGRLIRARENIVNRSGALHGERRPVGGNYRMTSAERDVAEQLRLADWIAWSFSTPILWHNHRARTWHMQRRYVPTLRDNRTLVDHMALLRAAMEATLTVPYHPAWMGGPTGDSRFYFRDACNYQWQPNPRETWQVVCTLERGHPRGWWHEAWQDRGTDPVAAIAADYQRRWNREGGL